MLAQLLTLLALLPFIGIAGCILVPKKQERTIFTIAMATVLIEAVLLAFLATGWIMSGFTPLLVRAGVLYESTQYTFAIEFFFDQLSAVFLTVATVLTGLIFIFSKYYLHREPGFKRFYYTTLLFFAGLTLIITAGNFEVLLIGWELIGISSVLLIAFYRDRFLPARNALKVFSVYRIADVFLLTAIWYAHHTFEKSVHFGDFAMLAAHYGDQLTILGLLLLAVALIKSAQFPVSYWLPRAMEGPTSSSAIFYGALSVHMGLFLLLRTYPLWAANVWVHVSVAVIGGVTALVASSIARVQSTTKTQIAYASITQIGVMFVEVALGLWWLALIHFVCNALLRTYQLLISPSMVGYLIHDQFFHFTQPPERIRNTFGGRIHATLYILSIKEWNMNSGANRFLWKPLKSLGSYAVLVEKQYIQIVLCIVFVLVLIATLIYTSNPLPFAASVTFLISIILYVRSYATKNSAQICWSTIMLGHMFMILSLLLATATTYGRHYFIMYIIGVALAYGAGWLCLTHLESKGIDITLRYYRGAIYAAKKLGHIFFIVCLLFIAFPISASFLAQDALLNLIPYDKAYLVFLFCCAYLLSGVSTMRLYTKLFFGAHAMSLHEKAYKSS